MTLMSNKQYQFINLASTYADFSVPTIDVLVEGQSLMAAGNVFLNDMKIELSCGMEASGCSFDVYEVFDEGSRTFKKELLSKYFQLGKKIEIKIGYIGTTTIFIGYISDLSYIVGADVPKIRVVGTDVKGLMMNNQVSCQWEHKKYSDVVTGILCGSSYSSFIESRVIEDTGELEKKIEMVNESDYDFIVRLAERVGFEFFALVDQIFFRKPGKYKESIMTLEWGVNILNLEMKNSMGGQVLEVEVRGYDEQNGKIIKGSAKSTIKMQASGKMALNGLKKVIMDPSVISEQEAKKIAESILQRINRRYVELRVECIGLPEIVPGRNITISKLGDAVDGEYYITKVNHHFNGDYFNTFFEARAGE